MMYIDDIGAESVPRGTIKFVGDFPRALSTQSETIARDGVWLLTISCSLNAIRQEKLH